MIGKCRSGTDQLLTPPAGARPILYITYYSVLRTFASYAGFQAGKANAHACLYLYKTQKSFLALKLELAGLTFSREIADYSRLTTSGMSKYKDLVKNGWHPEKKGDRPGIRGQVVNVHFSLHRLTILPLPELMSYFWPTFFYLILERSYPS